MQQETGPTPNPSTSSQSPTAAVTRRALLVVEGREEAASTLAGAGRACTMGRVVWAWHAIIAELLEPSSKAGPGMSKVSDAPRELKNIYQAVWWAQTIG